MHLTRTVQGSVLVVQGDTVLVEESHGIADARTGSPCSSRTRFQIASISKQFTAAAVLLLAERGALTLEDRLPRWIDGCPPWWRDITLHHLLAHTSGIGHWHDYPEIDLSTRVGPDDLRATFAGGSPLFGPGDGWHYCSPGYVLLAGVVQRAAGQPYREVLADRVFAPMGMERTFAGTPADGTADLAQGYDGDQPVGSWELDVVGMGAGDVWSTVEDMRAWLDGLRAGRLLDAAAQRLMFAQHARTELDRKSAGYGYGWFLGSLAGERARQHSGDNAGFKGYVAWLPESDRRIVVLSNQDRTTPAVLTELLEELLAPDR